MKGVALLIECLPGIQEVLNSILCTPEEACNPSTLKVNIGALGHQAKWRAKPTLKTYLKQSFDTIDLNKLYGILHGMISLSHLLTIRMLIVTLILLPLFLCLSLWSCSTPWWVYFEKSIIRLFCPFWPRWHRAVIPWQIWYDGAAANLPCKAILK